MAAPSVESEIRLGCDTLSFLDPSPWTLAPNIHYEIDRLAIRFP